VLDVHARVGGLDAADRSEAQRFPCGSPRNRRRTAFSTHRADPARIGHGVTFRRRVAGRLPAKRLRLRPRQRKGDERCAPVQSAAGVTVLTWGNTQQSTWAWWDECVDEAYTIVPPEAKNAEFAPGFDLAQLQTDLSAVAS